MHYEFLIEDATGTLFLEKVLPKILGANGDRHSWRTHPYKGIGRLPPDLRTEADPAKRILLNRLPKILAGYGKSMSAIESVVVVVVDLDRRNCRDFKKELEATLDQIRPKPNVLFRIAIEEIEAWLLGDRSAILKAFPKAKARVLDEYQQDSICGTWEKLADAIFPDGALALKNQGWPSIGQEKCKWATEIGSHLNPETNQSPSFQTFRKGLQRIGG